MAFESIGGVIEASKYIKKQEEQEGGNKNIFEGQENDINSVVNDTKWVSAIEKNKYISTPEQLLALRCSRMLDDERHKMLYLSLCKRTRSEIIEDALSFVSDAHARSKARLFSWKVKQLRSEWKAAGKNPDRELPAAKKRTKKQKPAGKQEALF